MSRNPYDAIGLNPNLHPHYTDHLAVICVIMGIPLLFTDDEHAKWVKKQYPDLKIVVADWEDVQLDPLVRDYDVFFQCEMWPREEMVNLLRPLENKYQKKIRNIHCPHGFSDKGFWLEKCVEEDITLIYGDNMIDLLKEREVWNRIGTHVRSGNYRYTYYQKHKEFYDSLIKKEVLSKFENPSLPLLIYAPTWQDIDASSSFDAAAPFILRNLPHGEYNLLVKLHPRIEENYPIEMDQITYPFRNHPQIAFVDKWSLIYPFLSVADAYLGDMSSVGYDYLAFNRPMFFLNQKKIDPTTDRSGFLFQCGVEIRPDEYFRLYSIVDQTLHKEEASLKERREEVLAYTFGDEVPFVTLKKEIWEACEQPRMEKRPIPGRR